MNARALALAALVVVAPLGCIGGVTPLACALASDCAQGESCIAGQCTLANPTCPTLQPTFTSVNNDLLQVGCGAKSNKCHNSTAVAAGTNGLDLQKDPYTALLGADGKGAPADSVAGRPAGLLRVKPGDANDSLLVIKLKLKGDSDLYGSSMPYDNPGAICQSAIDVIAQWVSAGAKND